MASCLINSECVDLKNKLYNLTWWATAINQITVPSGMSMSGGSTAIITTSNGVDVYKYNASTSSWKKCSSYATKSEVEAVDNKLKSSSLGEEISYTATATDTWECVGSVTLEKEGLVYVTSSYSVRCTGIAFGTVSTGTSPGLFRYESSTHIYRTPMFYLPAGTHYLFVKVTNTGGANKYNTYRYA